MRIRFVYPQQNEIAVVNLPNFEYLPLFYLFPKELLESECPSLVDMPRGVHGILTQEKWYMLLKSDHFLETVIDLTAYYIWPAFGITTYMECYSGNDPLWQLAHATPIWEKAFEHMSGITPQSHANTPKREQLWLDPDEFQRIMVQIGLHGIEENNLAPCIETIRDMRCAEDYDKRNSNAKRDFYRRWYHTRSKISSVSLDCIIETGGSDSLDNVNFVSNLEAQNEDGICSKLDAEEFSRSLNSLDHEILDLRVQGYTYQEISDKLKYKTHSAILKRINRIAGQYLDFTDEKEGLRDFLIG
jgi:hypothetical protein